MRECNNLDTSRIYKAENGTHWYLLGPSESIEGTQRMCFLEEHDGQFTITDIIFYFSSDLVAEMVCLQK